MSFYEFTFPQTKVLKKQKIMMFRQEVFPLPIFEQLFFYIPVKKSFLFLGPAEKVFKASDAGRQGEIIK